MPTHPPRIDRYIVQSGLGWVAAGFSILVLLNLITLALDPSRVLASLNGTAEGPFLSVFVFDSWGTTGGLAGVVVLFTPLVFAATPRRRVPLCLFFLAASVVIGVASNVFWTEFYDGTGFIGSGSSSIAFAGQAIIFAIAVTELLSILRSRSALTDPWQKALHRFFAVVCLTLITSSLYLILVLQPVFTPSTLYNWRVHEIAFLAGFTVTMAYQVVQGALTKNLVRSPVADEPK